MSDRSIDNSFEWLTGSKIATVTFSQQKWVNKILKYSETHSDVEIMYQNPDGSILAHVPVSWFKFSPPRKGREFSEEEKMQISERLKNSRQKRSNQNDI